MITNIQGTKEILEQRNNKEIQKNVMRWQSEIRDMGQQTKRFKILGPHVTEKCQNSLLRATRLNA